MALENIFFMATIDAVKKRKVAVMELPRAFLHAKNEREVITKMEQRLAELMVRMEPSIYWKYIAISKNGNCL